MTSELPKYWSQLEGTKHPEDAAVLAKHQGHAFNLEFPPPAFVGDVVRARIIILHNNGGYDPVKTPREFQRPSKAEEYRRRLAYPQPAEKGFTAEYYLTKNYAPFLLDGSAALVNGVAYRSVSGSSRGVAKLTKLLPSAEFHRRWLQKYLFPEVEAGKRLVIVHRSTRWLGAEQVFAGRNAIFRLRPRLRISLDLRYRR